MSGPKLTGFAFPFRVAGGVRRTTGFEKVEENVRHLLATRAGERVMLRAYGGGVHRRVQEPNDETLRALVRYEVEESLRRYAPEVELTAPLDISSHGSELTITLEYRADPTEVVRRFQFHVTR
jgi:phage baseplate assembly protein W